MKTAIPSSQETEYARASGLVLIATTSLMAPGLAYQIFRLTCDGVTNDGGTNGAMMSILCSLIVAEVVLGILAFYVTARR